MNTATTQSPSKAATTLITWVATLNIVWALASALALVTGHVSMVGVLGLLIGLPAAIKATRSSNHRKALLRHAAASAATPQYWSATRA
ncbi:hypothetical protein [uncultured Actinomyces sp.]|uniref:hypothetical protein n=1 Tax=uncultured Actinomyces sp. TaxID=249061 RepID=UPI0028056F6C|nr:hypothetical protein [uncultured Actinomyces sp.]